MKDFCICDAVVPFILVIYISALTCQFILSMICQIEKINNHSPEEATDHHFSFENLIECQEFLLGIDQKIEDLAKKRADYEQLLLELAAEGEGSLLVPLPASPSHVPLQSPPLMMDDTDGYDDEISWIEKVPVATISKGEQYRNTHAVRWKGIDWMVVVLKSAPREQDAKQDRVGYYLGYDTAQAAQIPHGWSLDVHSRCHVVDSEGNNVPHPVQDSKLSSHHEFSCRNGDSDGYYTLDRLSLSAALAHEDANQCVNLRFSLTAMYKPQTNPGLGYKSKEATGMVGMEGTFCELNSLLQMLHNINLFRKNVYLLPHEVKVSENAASLATSALQSIFRNLQCGNDYVTATDLTRAFGWNSQDDPFMQPDVQEMMRVLFDNLKEKMKGIRLTYIHLTLS